MESFSIYVLFALGILLIIKGGDFFVDSARYFAEAFGIPKFIVGATVVSLATTLPELMVSSLAAADGNTEIAIGNAIGSVIANTGLIMAISIIFLPMQIKMRSFFPKCSILFASIIALLAFVRGGALTVRESIVMLALFVLFIAENIFSYRQSIAEESVQGTQKDVKTMMGNLFLFILGTAGIVVGSDLLIDNGSAIAASLGVPENIIALTAIAVGTSLPELVTTITALLKREASLSIGNIVGANIIDITLILPLCAVISGGSLPVQAQTVSLDLPMCLLITAVCLVPTLIFRRFQRYQGVLAVLFYAAYLVRICVLGV
ncbi:MAG: calcium/sodium antiporter [Clostridia bacterium]|nr:calcium/sodium antiporter [Clostridia bacterium]